MNDHKKKNRIDAETQWEETVLNTKEIQAPKLQAWKQLKYKLTTQYQQKEQSMLVSM